jgi:hypothetical protein
VLRDADEAPRYLLLQLGEWSLFDLPLPACFAAAAGPDSGPSIGL